MKIVTAHHLFCLFMQLSCFEFLKKLISHRMFSTIGHLKMSDLYVCYVPPTFYSMNTGHPM